MKYLIILLVTFFSIQAMQKELPTQALRRIKAEYHKKLDDLNQQEDNCRAQGLSYDPFFDRQRDIIKHEYLSKLECVNSRCDCDNRFIECITGSVCIGISILLACMEFNSPVMFVPAMVGLTCCDCCKNYPNHNGSIKIGLDAMHQDMSRPLYKEIEIVRDELCSKDVRMNK